LNKKLQKGLVAAVAATLSTGIVAPVYAASVETKSFDAQYAEAYNATVNAKTQKELTAARVLVDKLYADLPQDLKNLAATLSAILDPKQQTELVKLDNAIKAASVSGKQADVNVARALIVDMPTVWKNSFSSYMDGIQQPIINKAVEAAKKAQTSGLKADYDAALALYNDLLTVTNNDGVKAWAEVALKAELDAAAKLTVVSVKAINNTQAVVTFSSEVAAVNADNFVSDNDVVVVKAEVNSTNKKEVKLTFNSELIDGENYVIEVQEVKNLLGNSVAEGTEVELEYEVADLAKVELTDTTFLNGDNIFDSVKVTDAEGRDITDILASSYDYTMEITTTNPEFITSGTYDVDADAGDVSAVTEKSYAYVQVTVFDADGEEVATTEAVKLTLNTVAIESNSFVGFHIGAVLPAEGTDGDYSDLVEDEDVKTYVKMSDNSYLNVVAKLDGDDYLLEAADIDKIENLTPTVANVNDDLSIETIATGTAKVKITAGDLVYTVTFTVKADSDIKSADLDKTSVVVNSTDGSEFEAATLTLSLLDQYGEDIDATVVDGTVTVAGEEVGTLSIKSSRTLTATAALGDATDSNEVPVTITAVGNGTSTVTITFKDTDDDTVFTKTISVTSKEFGDFAGYKVEVDNTALELDDEDEDSAEFSVYAVDASGNKIETVSGAVLSLQDTDADQYFTVNGMVIAPTADAVLKMGSAGTLKVDVKVNEVKVGTTTIKVTNTGEVATKATVNTANVVLDLSKTYDNENALTLNINDLIFGLLDADDEYIVNPILTILDQTGKAIEYDTDVQGTLSNDEVVTRTISVTNKTNVDYLNGVVTLDADETSGSFTLVISAVDTDKNDDLLAAPVAVKVTVVR
jgi:hypothetical protein